MASRLKVWLILIVLLAAFAAATRWDPERHVENEGKKDSHPVTNVENEIPPASLEPGRVVTFKTTKGTIEFILLEKDCPHTTSFIAKLVEEGRYDGKKFTRVDENSLIKTATCARGFDPPSPEFRKGLEHDKGAVGLAQWTKRGEASGAIYLTMEPMHNIDYKYTTFGRVISGMDVMGKIRVGDIIRRATIRPATETDKKRLTRVLVIATERRVD
jgi:peptidylprolyl isomerase